MKIFYTYAFILCCMPFASKASEAPTQSRPSSPKPHTKQEWAQYLQARDHKPRIFPIYPWNTRNLTAAIHTTKKIAPALPTIVE